MSIVTMKIELTFVFVHSFGIDYITEDEVALDSEYNWWTLRRPWADMSGDDALNVLFF